MLYNTQVKQDLGRTDRLPVKPLIRPLYTLLIIFFICVVSHQHPRPLVDTISITKQHTVKTIKAVNHPAVSQAVAISAPTPIVTSNVVANCGDNTYANFIYSHESGCNLDAVNASSGDFGLGQSAGGLAIACPDWQTDYTCQNNFFTSYADSRYGGWEQAYDFWINNSWW